MNSLKRSNLLPGWENSVGASVFLYYKTSAMHPPIDDFIRRCKLDRVIDGDTLVLAIDLGFGTSKTEIVRLSGVDTPEPRGHESAAGRWVTERVLEWIGNQTEVWIHSRRYTTDKYQRCVAEVWIGGHSLNSWLIQKGYAWPTDDGGQIIGVRSVEGLSIPDGVKQQVREALA